MLLILQPFVLNMYCRGWRAVVKTVSYPSPGFVSRSRAAIYSGEEIAIRVSDAIAIKLISKQLSLLRDKKSNASWSAYISMWRLLRFITFHYLAMTAGYSIEEVNETSDLCLTYTKHKTLQ